MFISIKPHVRNLFAQKQTANRSFRKRNGSEFLAGLNVRMSKSWSSFRDNFHLFQWKTNVDFHISVFPNISVYIKYRSVIKLISRF